MLAVVLASSSSEMAPSSYSFSPRVWLTCKKAGVPLLIATSIGLRNCRLQLVVAAPSNEHLSLGDRVAFACKPALNDFIPSSCSRRNGQRDEASFRCEATKRCDLFGLACNRRRAGLGFQRAPAEGSSGNHSSDDQTLTECVAILGWLAIVVPNSVLAQHFKPSLDKMDAALVLKNAQVRC